MLFITMTYLGQIIQIIVQITSLCTCSVQLGVIQQVMLKCLAGDFILKNLAYAKFFHVNIIKSAIVDRSMPVTGGIVGIGITFGL